MKLKQLITQTLPVIAALGINHSVLATTPHDIVVGSMSEGAFFFDHEIVKDAPFSATATTRSVQQLADGNRIVNEDTTRITRDSNGRVRRESVNADRPGDISISDPSNKRSLMLNERSKTAFEMPMGLDFLDVENIELPDVAAIAEEIRAIELPVELGHELSGELETLLSHEISGALESLPAEVIMIDHRNMAGVGGPDGIGVASGLSASAAALPQVHAFASIAAATLPMNAGTTETKPLGQKKMSGVRVEGTQHTTTIPAGTIGNERPIVITKTSWYAPDLRLMIRSEESDPRFGTITYEVDIDSQNEPDSALFEVPEGYRLVGPGAEDD